MPQKYKLIVGSPGDIAGRVIPCHGARWASEVSDRLSFTHQNCCVLMLKNPRRNRARTAMAEGQGHPAARAAQVSVVRWGKVDGLVLRGGVGMEVAK